MNFFSLIEWNFVSSYWIAFMGVGLIFCSQNKVPIFDDWLRSLCMCMCSRWCHSLRNNRNGDKDEKDVPSVFTCVHQIYLCFRTFFLFLLISFPLLLGFLNVVNSSSSRVMCELWVYVFQIIQNFHVFQSIRICFRTYVWYIIN